MLIQDGKKYKLWDYDKDEVNNFEPIIIEHVKDIFSQNAICLSKQKLKTRSGVGSIPDALVIDFSNSKWYVLEVELSNHPLHDHVVPQVTKFISGIRNPETRKIIVKAFYDEISSSGLKEEIKKITGDEIHKTITDIIDNDPINLIIIDKKNSELNEVCSQLSKMIPTLSIEFKTYINRNTAPEEHIHLFKPLDLNYSDSPSCLKSDFIRESDENTGSRRPSICGYDEVMKNIDENFHLNPDEKETIHQLSQQILSIDSSIKIQLPNYEGLTITFLKGNRRFAALDRPDLDVPKGINMKARFIKVKNLNDPRKLAKELPDKDGCWRMSFEMTSKSDIEYVLFLIKQAYEYMSSNN